MSANLLSVILSLLYEFKIWPSNGGKWIHKFHIHVIWVNSRCPTGIWDQWNSSNSASGQFKDFWTALSIVEYLLVSFYSSINLSLYLFCGTLKLCYLIILHKFLYTVWSQLNTDRLLLYNFDLLIFRLDHYSVRGYKFSWN